MIETDCIGFKINFLHFVFLNDMPFLCGNQFNKSTENANASLAFIAACQLQSGQLNCTRFVIDLQNTIRKHIKTNQYGSDRTNIRPL